MNEQETNLNNGRFSDPGSSEHDHLDQVVPVGAEGLRGLVGGHRPVVRRCHRPLGPRSPVRGPPGVAVACLT